MRTIARRKHISKTTVSETVLEITEKVKDSIWISKHFEPKWGHVLSVDGKMIRVFNRLAQNFVGSGAEKSYLLKKSFLCGVDVLTKDLPHYRVADGETKIDMYEYFKTLRKDIGYDLRVLVCDGNLETMEGARRVYGARVGVQLCVRHFVEMLKSIAREEKGSKRKQTDELVGNIWQALGERREVDCFKRLKELQSIQETPAQRSIFRSLTKHVYLLTTHFRYHSGYYVPRYNNDCENLFKQLSLRLKSWNMFRNPTNAENYLKTWALARRFTKFTDCRGHMNAPKNGKAPLELAGVNITNLDYLNLK